MSPEYPKDYRKNLRRVLAASAAVLACALSAACDIAPVPEVQVSNQSYGSQSGDHASHERPDRDHSGEGGDGRHHEKRHHDRGNPDQPADDQPDEQQPDQQQPDEQQPEQQPDEQQPDEQQPDGAVDSGPVAADFVDITTVRPTSPANGNGFAANGGYGSTGTFITYCGVNGNKLYNSDNVIVAPGVDQRRPPRARLRRQPGQRRVLQRPATSPGAGPAARTGRQVDLLLAGAAPAGRHQGVRRRQAGRRRRGQHRHDPDGPAGRPWSSSAARRGKVVAMPQFLRIITGDAKAFTNGTANANASWSCTGFENKVQLTDKYPLCPAGQRAWCAPSSSRAAGTARTSTAPTTVRTWPSPTPTATARTASRRFRSWCSAWCTTWRTRASRTAGQTRRSRVDGFPEQLHKPVTDHGDFINVFDAKLMNKMVQCINTGRKCG